jgi:hypothetical protein
MQPSSTLRSYTYFTDSKMHKQVSFRKSDFNSRYLNSRKVENEILDPPRSTTKTQRDYSSQQITASYPKSVPLSPNKSC